jgi:hypothetical protein
MANPSHYASSNTHRRCYHFCYHFILVLSLVILTISVKSHKNGAQIWVLKAGILTTRCKELRTWRILWQVLEDPASGFPIFGHVASVQQILQDLFALALSIINWPCILNEIFGRFPGIHFASSVPGGSKTQE